MEKEYQKLRPILDLVEIEAKHCLDTALSQTEIRIHALSSRVKSLESLSKKLERKREAETQELGLETVTDLVGLRVVCLFIGDIEKIGLKVKECFKVIAVDDKITSTDSSVFGYQGVHFIAKIKDEYVGPRYDAIKHQVFEIQIRTITMDAWAAASHYLDYKNEKGVPSALRKDFFALSGLFYVADTHFEMFFDEAKKSKIQTEEKTQSKDELLSKEINVDTVRYYLKRRFPDRKALPVESVSDLTNELIDAGYQTISDLEKDLDRGKAAFEAYEKDNPPGSTSNKRNKQENIRRFADVGVVRVTLELVNEDYLNRKGNNEHSIATMEAKRGKYQKFIKS